VPNNQPTYKLEATNPLSLTYVLTSNHLYTSGYTVITFHTIYIKVPTGPTYHPLKWWIPGKLYETKHWAKGEKGGQTETNQVQAKKHTKLKGG
jgi:hypothetical protein